MENGNQNQEPQRFGNQGPVQYQPQYDMPGSNANRKKKKHLALAVTSLVLSGISLLGCWFYVIGIVPALIGGIFGLVALVGGKDKSVRIMGGIGMGIGIIVIGLSIFMMIGYCAIINWDNLTPENIMRYQNIDPQNRREIIEWMQQFFNVDISSSMYY